MIASDIIAAKGILARTRHPLSRSYAATNISQTPLMRVFQATNLPATELLLSLYSITIYTCSWRDLVGIRIINAQNDSTYAVYGHIDEAETEPHARLLTDTDDLVRIDNALEERALMRVLELAGVFGTES